MGNFGVWYPLNLTAVEAVNSFLKALKVFSLAESLGGVDSWWSTQLL